MLFGRKVAQLAGTMDFNGLHHSFCAKARVGFARRILDGVNGRASEEEDVLYQTPLFCVGQIESNVALIEGAGADNRRRFDSGQRPREDFFRSEPFRAVGPEEWCARLYWGSLAKIDSIEPRQQIDHFAPNAAGFHAN